MPQYVADILAQLNAQTFNIVKGSDVDAEASANWAVLTSDGAANAAWQTIMQPLIMRLPAATTLTISSGSVAYAQRFHSIDPEGAATVDDLDTITGGSVGDLLLIRVAGDSDIIRVRHNIGLSTNKIILQDGQNAILEKSAITRPKFLLFVRVADPGWYELYRNFPYVRSMTFTIETPTATEDVMIHRFQRAVTIVEVEGTIRGGTSVTINPKHAADRSAAGTALLSSATAISNTTTGQEITSFNDADIDADEILWLETTALSGTVDELSLTITYIDGHL